MDEALSLTRGMKDAILRQQDREAVYLQRRRDLQAALKRSGIADEAALLLLESFEGSWRPGFGTAATRDYMNAAPRRVYDEAIRKGLTEQDFSRFVTALTEHRGATDTLHRVEQTTLGLLGPKALEKAVEEAERLAALRRDIVDVAQSVNPDLAVETVYRLAGDDAGNAAYDPLARTVTVALDYADGAGTGEPRQALYRRLWDDVEPFLSEKERKVLEETFLAEERGSRRVRETADRLYPEDWERRRDWAAERFAEFVQPSRRKRMKKPVRALFAPVGAFLERAANAAKGRGFTRAEDVWALAKAGDLARRRQALREADALRVPDREDNPAAFERLSFAIGRLSEQELAEAVQRQEMAIGAAAARRAGLLRTLVVRPLLENRAARAARSALNWFDGAYEDPVRKESRDLRDRQRAMVLLKKEQRRRREKEFGLPAAEKGQDGPNPAGPAGPAPGPTPPGPGMSAPPSSAMARHMQHRLAAVANDNGQAAPAAGAEAARGVDLPAVRGVYHLQARSGHPGPFYLVEMTPHGSAVRLGLASAASKEAAAAMMSAVDQARPTGDPSPVARRLAAAARASEAREGGGLLDGVDAVRKSGLLDREMDDAIGRKDLQALVFPLRTGDVVWREPSGEWQAGTLEGFAQAQAARGDRHLANAQDAIKDTAAARAQDKRTWLDVPPSEEGSAERAGARFDRLANRWYAPDRATAQSTLRWQGDAAHVKRKEEFDIIAGDVRIDPANQDHPFIAGRHDPAALRASLQAGGSLAGRQATDRAEALNPARAAAYSAGAEGKEAVVVVDLGRAGVNRGSQPGTADAMAAAVERQALAWQGAVILVTDRADSADPLTRAAHARADTMISAGGLAPDAPLPPELVRRVAEAIAGREAQVMPLWAETGRADEAAGQLAAAVAADGGKARLAAGLSDETLARTLPADRLQAVWRETAAAAKAAESLGDAAKAVSLAHRLTAYGAVMKERGVEVPQQHDTKKRRPTAGHGR